MKRLIKDLTFDELKKWLENIGEKPFRTSQIFEWLYKKNATDVMQFTNLPLELREKIEDEFLINSLQILKHQSDGESIKFLFELCDKNGVESVFLPYRYGNAICVSTQVGCKMNCRFCASAIGGFVRNLSAGEMVDQIINVENFTGKRITNVVLMGSGEPFDNIENVFKFIEIINSKEGKNIGARHITISTVGIVEGIYRLCDFPKQVNLAISLHAPNNSLRDKLVPINKKYPVEDIMKAVDYYIKRTNRRVTFEYALIDGVNDSIECAQELGKMLKGKLVHVNLIPVNPVEEKGFRRPSKEKIKVFFETLKSYQINVTIRRELGSSISAACGQLRKRYFNI
ncbi:23S rRNA (adenine2503-C2)-methyltransferase [Caldicellulosiruptor bescii]|uniref:Probable dual-specificity RNA methyltransferase RlmN n=2 Tax=Caldicellulosiruptor bescii TaxID=31899 RepID=B9MR40_CALBD|nr:23S rRNA (adenine(2503)-C(2))-methyltransferase RlmN [Caldicellulosiruptor bescii]ACM60144.1 radical SAM enzyme, Cfr family [Caldicellulosiruptor bescii DSM 6725]PBC87559.1 23S rRNA (adenine2503-C2)-methyltransferase [Caldicellulosiruptor bescii]PBC90492.1 23S rRNA (adenine2503-C2)-methyltransferase [Caldicellulosiruptor bescii]PBD04076.1 23S rRNA (adenine2503-C2)-methyltransferase [Caldicellulosiruptor bescii]PBD06289.1 23S rRNA (adenine2503-C2)-methyltransferase [Caldicellulosiruptor besc